MSKIKVIVEKRVGGSGTVSKSMYQDLKNKNTNKRNASKEYHIIRLNKNGSESKMHDAIYYFSKEQEALDFHNRLVELNPKRKIENNLYKNGTFQKKLSGEVR